MSDSPTNVVDLDALIRRSKVSGAQVATAQDTRVRIPVAGNRDVEVVGAAVQALTSLDDVFACGGRLATLNGSEVKPLDGALLRMHLSRAVDWTRKNADGDTVSVGAPKHIVDAILSLGAWSDVRELAGVITAPVLRPDGTVFDGAGWDESTKLFRVAGGASFQVPDAPTPEDAQKAARRILEVVGEFPFAAEADKAAWLALVLTPIARPAIEGLTPLFFVNANVPGSGKTILVGGAALIATGVEVPVTTVPRRQEEWAKVMHALSQARRPFVLLDNAKGRVGSPHLDAALTSGAGGFDSRVLGSSNMSSAAFRCTWTLTANNGTLTDDGRRRAQPISLVSRHARPEDQNYTVKDFLAHVKAHRTELLRDALTLLRAFVVAGRPQPDVFQSWASFESWSSWVRAAVVFAGLPDPIGARAVLDEGLAEESVSGTDALGVLLKAWPGVVGVEAVSARDLVEMLTATKSDALEGALRELGDIDRFTPLTPRSTGYALRKISNVPHSEGRLVSGRNDSNSATWKFEINSANCAPAVSVKTV